MIVDYPKPSCQVPYWLLEPSTVNDGFIRFLGDRTLISVLPNNVMRSAGGFMAFVFTADLHKYLVPSI